MKICVKKLCAAKGTPDYIRLGETDRFCYIKLLRASFMYIYIYIFFKVSEFKRHVSRKSIGGLLKAWDFERTKSQSDKCIFPLRFFYNFVLPYR